MRSKLHTFRSQLATTGALLRLVWQANRGFFVLSFGLALLLGLLPLASIVLTSALLQTLVDATRAGPAAAGFPGRFVLLLALLAGVHLLGQLGQQLNTVVHELYRARVTNHIQLLISARAVSIDLAHFEDPAFHNQMQTAVNEAAFRVPMFVDRLLIGGSTIATLVSLSGLLLWWQPWIVPLLLGSSLCTLWIATHFNTLRVRAITGRAEAERKKYYLQGLLASDQAAKELRLFGLGPWLLSGLREVLERIYAQDRRLALRELAVSGATGLLLAAVQPALIAFSAWQVLRGLLSIGQFSLYSQAIIQLQAGWTQLMFVQSGLHENSLFAAQLFQFLALEPRIEARRDGPDRPLASPPRIEFRSVSFAYPGSQQRVLDDLSFVIEPGDTIALVGQNGAGKTTLVKLLAGLYEPSAGTILLDGHDLRTLDRAAVRAYLGVIFQDYTIYHLSTHDNVGVGQVQAIDQPERIVAAARRSGLDRLVARLPHGYETVLGRFWEHGHELSGGQRQLVALARALMRDAPILILDEPSAALDIYSEQRFFTQLLAEPGAQPQRTVIFISHRFTTVRRARRILVLEHGRIIEQGSHAELMAQAGHYAEMFTMQAAPYSQPQPDSSAAAELELPTT